MKVLVTGGSGGVGSHIVPALLARGYEVVVFDRREGEFPAGVASLTGDLCDPADVLGAIEEVDAVVHLAAILPPVSEEDPRLAESVNVGGTRNLIAAMQSSPSCKRLIFTSSTAVHGSQPGRVFPIREDEPFDPPDNYAKQKIAAEQLVRESGLEWTILRIAATPPTKIAKGPSGGLRLFLTIPPDSRIEVLHPDDAGIAYANCIECEGAIGRTLFLGGGRQNGCQVTGYEMCCGMTRAFGIGDLPRHLFNTDSGDAHAEWLDTSESQSLLNYQTRSFEDLVGDIRQNQGLAYPVSRAFAPLIRFAITHFLARKRAMTSRPGQ